MSVAVGLAGWILDKPGELRCKFGSLGYWTQDTGWLSVSILGAVSAESCGRDSFVEAAGFSQRRFGLSAEADEHQTE
jgi:hypothetical protein